MNLKRLLITTMLVASQISMVLPASAEEMGQGNGVDPSTVTQQPANNGTSTQPTDVVQPGDTPLDQGTNDGTTGETIPGDSQDGTENGDESLPPTSPVTPPADQGTQNQSNSGQLILMVNSNKMYQNGKEYLAGYPMEVKDGVSYISIRAIVERAGFQLSFDNKTKETIIKRGSDELRFKLNTTSYKVNGVTQTMRGKSYSAKNNFMVPLTAITKALNITYSYDSVGKRVIVNLNTLPYASFTIGNNEVVAGETQVQYVTNASSPIGLPIVNEEWIGRQDMFMTPGIIPLPTGYRIPAVNGVIRLR